MIPRTIHQMWLIDGPPIPDTYAGWVEDWQRLHEGWQHNLWVGPPAMTPANVAIYHMADRISRDAPEQFRSDIARYEILYQHGGVWLDVDFEPHHPIDDLMDGGPWVVRHADKWVANGVMGFPAGHPAMADAIARLPESVEKALPHWGNTRRSGPQFLTPVLEPYIRSGEVRVLPADTFIPYEWNELEKVGQVQGTYATHHFHNQRRKRGMLL